MKECNVHILCFHFKGNLIFCHFKVLQKTKVNPLSLLISCNQGTSNDTEETVKSRAVDYLAEWTVHWNVLESRSFLTPSTKAHGKTLERDVP